VFLVAGARPWSPRPAHEGCVELCCLRTERGDLVFSLEPSGVASVSDFITCVPASSPPLFVFYPSLPTSCSRSDEYARHLHHILTAMVSVAELLNPEPPRAPLPTSRPAPVSPIPRTAALRDQASLARRSIETLGIMDNIKTPPPYKAKGTIHFSPFETLDEASLREVRKFQVHPLGSIRETCERIPYNSGKKDFFSKTGREGFEGKDATPGQGAGLTNAAFHYDFRVPGDDTNYTVMWDYNVGLVRMTSFFKCRGYSKVSASFFCPKRC
jgi:hypothetical protein